MPPPKKKKKGSADADEHRTRAVEALNAAKIAADAKEKVEGNMVCRARHRGRERAARRCRVEGSGSAAECLGEGFLSRLVGNGQCSEPCSIVRRAGFGSYTYVCAHVTGLRGVMEITLHQHPHLLGEFVPEFRALGMSQEVPVRRWSITAIASIATAHAEYLLSAIEHVMMMLDDGAKEVRKQAVISSIALLTRSLAAMRLPKQSQQQPQQRDRQKTGGQRDPIQANGQVDPTILWSALQGLVRRVCALSTADETPDSVRLHAIKFVEQSTLACVRVHSPSDPAPGAVSLPGEPSMPWLTPEEQSSVTSEAMVLFRRLLPLLPKHTLSGPAFIVLMNTLTMVAISREVLYVEVANAFLELAATFGTSLWPAEGDVEKASNYHAVVSAIGNLIKNCWNEAALSMREKLAGALRNRFRAVDQANQAVRYAEKMAAKEVKQSKKRGRQPGGESEVEPADEKRQKMEQGEGGAAAAGETQEEAEEAEAEKDVLIQQNLAVLTALVKRNDANALKGFVQTMELGLLTDIVMLNLNNLPPEPPASEPSVSPMAGGITIEPGVPKPKFGARMHAERAIASKPPPGLKALELSDEERTKMRKDALERMIRGSTASPSTVAEAVSVDLLVHVVDTAPQGDQSEKYLLQHLFQDWNNRNGHKICVALLYRRFIRCSSSLRHGGDGGEVEESDAGADVENGYTSLLLRLLCGLKDSLPSSDRAIQSLIKEAPSVSASAVQFLGASCQGEWSTLILSTLRDIVMSNAAVRRQALRCILVGAVSKDDEVRGKGVRLVANRLMPVDDLAEEILAFARDALAAATRTDDVPEMKDAGVDMGSTSVFPLFLALSTKMHDLLHELSAAYALASPQQRQIVHVNLPGLVRAVGANSDVLQSVIAAPPKGAETFSLQCLHAAVDAAKQANEEIPRALVVSAQALHVAMDHDGRAVIPVLSAMSPEDALECLPKLVALQEAQWKSALVKLLQVAPAERILVALHELEPSRDGTPLKKIIEAITACLSMQNVYTSETIALAIDRIVELDPLPLLFMRTLIQCVSAHPGLASFARGVLMKLVNRQVWNMSPKVWKGFLHSLKQLSPGSFEVIQQLPVEMLDDVMKAAPELMKPFTEYMSAPARRVAVSREFLVKIGLEA